MIFTPFFQFFQRRGAATALQRHRGVGAASSRRCGVGTAKSPSDLPPLVADGDGLAGQQSVAHLGQHIKGEKLKDPIVEPKVTHLGQYIKC